MYQIVASLRGHNDRCTSVAWHPTSTLGLSPSVVNAATSGADTNVCLWSLQGGDVDLDNNNNSNSNGETLSPKLLHMLKGHQNRVNRVAFHPSGKVK